MCWYNLKNGKLKIKKGHESKNEHMSSLFRQSALLMTRIGNFSNTLEANLNHKKETNS